jgi:sulfur carrier protein
MESVGGTDMSDTIGHDGPSETGDDGPVVITVNGRRMWVKDSGTVAVLLESLGYPARGVAVALNRAVLPRSAWQTKLSDGARLQVLTAVQAESKPTIVGRELAAADQWIADD